MLTIPQLTQAVKAAPMPLHLKEQILDQVVGHHDDLHRPARRAVRPMAERVAEARQVGAFDFVKRLPSGDEVYDYCKNGAFAYRFVTRDSQPVFCGCKDFELGAAVEPDYECKHCHLWREMEAGEFAGGERMAA